SGNGGLPGAAPRGSTAKQAPSTFDFEVDLPDAGRADPLGDIDLPSTKASVDADLPMPKGPRGGGFGSIDLPAPRRSSADFSLGEEGLADLPMVQNDLPQIGGSLPMPVVGGGLPVPKGAARSGVAPARSGGAFGELDLPSPQ